MKNNSKQQDQCTVRERHGQLVFAINSEILLPENAPVRLTSAQLEDLDYEKLYRAYSPRGRKSKVDPRVMFKVMVYGYQCGIYSSRKLEEACKYRIDFKWLLEDREEPDHSTFARFRTGRCGEAVEDLFYQYVKLLEKQEETDHKTVFVDGTKLESRAGRYTFCWRGSVEKQLNRVREKVFQLTGRKKRQALQEYLAQQREHIAFVHGKGKHKSEEQRRWEDLDALCKRWAEYEDSLKIMGEARNSYSKTDPDATFMRMKDDHKELLKGIAAERIQVELTKMLCRKGVTKVLEEFADIIAIPIPEILPMFHFEQRNPHHDKDVWGHTIAVIDNIAPKPVLRWAALLHDIGKPQCFSIGEDGIGHFFGHAEKSTAMAEEILNRMRFDNAGKERILRLVRYHDMPITADRKLIKRLLSKHGEEASRQLIELHRADTLGQSSICIPRLATFGTANAMIDELLQEENCFTLKDLAVNGNDMMSIGLKGKAIGNTLQACLDAVIDERVPNDHASLLALAREQMIADTDQILSDFANDYKRMS